MELDEGDQIKQEQPVVINPIQLDQLTQGAIAEEVRKAVRELTSRVNIQNPTIDLARTVYEIDRLDTIDGGGLKVEVVPFNEEVGATYDPNSLRTLTFADMDVFDREVGALRDIQESNNLISNEGMIRPPAPKPSVGGKSQIPVSIKRPGKRRGRPTTEAFDGDRQKTARLETRKKPSSRRRITRASRGTLPQPEEEVSAEVAADEIFIRGGLEQTFAQQTSLLEDLERGELEKKVK